MSLSIISRWTLLATALLLVAFIVAFGLFPHEASRVTLNQIRATASMRELVEAEKTRALARPQSGYTCDLPQLEGIDRVLAGGEKAGYRFTLSGCRLDSSGKVLSYAAAATPLQRELGHYVFCANEQGSIWYIARGSAEDCFQNRSPAKEY